MKILMTGDAVGGVWTYSMELARALGKSGIEVFIVTMGPRPSIAQREQIAAIKTAHLYGSEYKLEWMNDPWDDVRKAGRWLLEMESELEPDVVHLNGYTHGALPWKAPKLIVAHSCVLSWWLAVKGSAAPDAHWRWYRENVYAGLQAADFVVAPTRAMLNSIRTLYGELRNAAVVPNGREPEDFFPELKKEPVIVSAGRLWDEAKNIGMLDSICADLRWPVWIAGETADPTGETVFRYVGGCHLLGHLSPDGFADILARAAIFCLPARYEPFGLSALEAALSGCALVLGDIPSLRETWDGAALFVSPTDESELANTLNDLSRDSARRDGLAACANRRAVTLTATKMAAQYRAIYAALLKRNESAVEYKVRACAS